MLRDTSVLWPSLHRDFVLSVAIEGLDRPLFSTAILAELGYHETLKLTDRGEQPAAAAARAHHRVDQMSTAFDDALVGGAGVIVTSNLKDFPPHQIPEPVKVVSALQFAADTVAVSPNLAHRAVQIMAARYYSPPLNVDAILDRLTDRYRMAEAVDPIRAAN